MTIKLVHITDPHLPLPGQTLFGLDPYDRLDACFRHIDVHHSDADLVIISGDLAHDGDPAAYAMLSARVKDVIPPVRLMLGNHDDRQAFFASFPTVSAEGPFVQSVWETGQGHVITLDTLQQGHVEGHLCPERLSWLDTKLADAHGRRVFLFMHHPPFDVHVPSLDSSRLVQAAELLDVLRRHGNVDYIFAGHVHRQISGLWHGIGFSTLPGTSHQSAANFRTDRFSISFEPPVYSVILIDPISITVHAIDFLERTEGQAGSTVRSPQSLER